MTIEHTLLEVANVTGKCGQNKTANILELRYCPTGVTFQIKSTIKHIVSYMVPVHLHH